MGGAKPDGRGHLYSTDNTWGGALKRYIVELEFTGGFIAEYNLNW